MKHVLISGLTLNDAVLLSSPSSSSLVLSCGSHCDNDRVVAETDGGSALIVPSACLPTARSDSAGCMFGARMYSLLSV